MKKVFVIIGPTSSGKTSLAYKLSKKLNAEIISADSRQVYKYMDIGTGKVPVNSDLAISRHESFWDFDDVRIWGYDLVAPDQTYSAYDFALFAQTKTRELLAEGKNVIVAGGTGFYIDLYTGRVKPSSIMPDPELRHELAQLDLAGLQEMLCQLNSEEFSRTDINNKVRLIRSIERNQPPAPEKNAQPQIQTPLPYLEDIDFVTVGLTGPRELLYLRSNRWVDVVWQNGLVDEAKKLVDMGYRSTPRMQGLIYKTVLDHLDSKLSAESAIQQIKYDIHAYIRRQQTYFKKISGVTWFDISEDCTEEIVYNFFEEER